MKKQNLKKVIAMAVIATGILTLAPTGASAAWRENSTGWWNTEGNSYSIGWRNIDGTWYYFDNNGYMKTGWLNNGGWYYFSPSGVMQTGWIQDGGYWYYLKPNGTMATGNVVIDGKISKFDITGKWAGYINNNQNNNSSGTQTNTTGNNTQQSNVTNNSNNQANTNSNTVSNNTSTNANNTQQTNAISNSNNQRNTNSNTTTNNAQTRTNNTRQTNVTNNSNTQRNTNSNNRSSNITTNENSNNNQTTISNQANREFSIDDALRMISNFKGVVVTLTPPGPTSGIDAAYEKLHKDGKVGYYISSYLFGGRRVDNSNGILIFEDGSYKQYKQGHHPSDLAADEWTREKQLYDAALKDFLNSGQPHQQDGSSTYYYNGVQYNFGFTQGMESSTFYKAFHSADFDRDGNYIETSNDYLETANISNH